MDTHAHVSMDATLSVHVKVISHDRNSGHVSAKCKDFQNKKNRKKKKEVTRTTKLDHVVRRCIYYIYIKDAIFSIHFSCEDDIFL